MKDFYALYAELQLRLTDDKGVPVTESWYYRWVPL